MKRKQWLEKCSELTGVDHSNDWMLLEAYKGGFTPSEAVAGFKDIDDNDFENYDDLFY